MGSAPGSSMNEPSTSYGTTLNFVALNFTPSKYTGIKWYVESVDPAALQPKDIHQAQLLLRLASMSAWPVWPPSATSPLG